MNIYIGKHASRIEERAAADLAEDLGSVLGTAFNVTGEPERLSGDSILVGTSESSSHINRLNREGLLGLEGLSGGAEGGSIDVASLGDGGRVLVLAGTDSMGVQFTVYDFCTRELGIDPCSFWTGYAAAKQANLDIFQTESRVLPSPKVPVRCYFDNDNDELANMTEPFLEIDFSYWKELIDTLLRLKYNALDLHDHLGRSEYVTREPYLKLRPDYAVNIKLVNQVIDYAKSRGMKIQTSFFLGWSFRAISDEAAHNWRDNKETWLEIWSYYLKETPIGRSDIFLNRPRDQKLDHPFSSSVGEDVVDVFNEAFPLMNDLIRAHNPNALVIVDLYSEGRDAYRKGFRPKPPEDYILCWPDDGFGAFADELEHLYPYKAGIYMHAGFWRNHVVADPCVELLETSMKNALGNYGMTEYCLVNGQTFRHFLLNIEACAQLCWYGTSFSGEAFTADWITRYFGSSLIPQIKELLNLLHAGQTDKQGYVRILSYISEWQALDAPQRRCSGEWAIRREEAQSRAAQLEKGLHLIEGLQESFDDSRNFLHDHFYLPFMLLKQINQILISLLEVPGAENRRESSDIANRLIAEHTELRRRGDRNPDWTGWYAPEKARPNGGYPKVETGPV